MRNEKGFNLINILTSIALLFAVVWSYNWWMGIKELEDAEKIVQKSSKAIANRFKTILHSDVAWRNTMYSRNNGTMACLRDHTSCELKGGPFILLDDQNRVAYDSTTLSSGITFDGGPCLSFKEEGSESCPFRLDLTWAPQCPIGECLKPGRIFLRGKLRFRGAPGTVFAKVKLKEIEFVESRAPAPGEPRTCLEHLEAGHNRSGLYNVKAFPDAPAFPVYCDQERDGGGWALIAAAGVAGYNVLRESNALTPTSVAHLPAPKVKALLENSRSLDTNNIRLDFPDVDQGIVLFASTNGSVETDNYSAETNSGSCNKVDQNQVHIATHTPAEMFTIQFKGNGEAGLSYQTTMSEGFHGFYVCFGNQEDGSSCGKGCGRSWTGRLFSQKGMLWIR